MADGAADSDDQIAIQQFQLFNIPSKAPELHSWVEWFCSFKGHEYLVEVEKSYIQDEFNLIGLKKQFKSHFK
jgi:hypothetical protein